MEDSSIRVVRLEDMGWARLMFALLSQRFSGRAEFDQSGVRRRIVFQGGFPVWTDHEVPNTGVSQILASAGMLSTEEAETLRAAAANDSIDALDAAAELGLVDEDSAAMALRDQCEQRVITTAGLGGEIMLHDDPSLPQVILDRLQPARTLRMITRGVRQYCSPSTAERALDDIRGKPVAVSEAFTKYADRFALNESEKTEMRLLSSRRSFRIDDLMEISGLDVVRSLQILYMLWACNMLVEADPESDAAAGPSPDSDRVLAKLTTGARPYDVLKLQREATLADIDAAAQLISSDSGKEIAMHAYAQRGLLAKTAARKALEDRRWARGVEALRDLVTLNPDEIGFRLDLAWCEWNVVERRGEAEARALDEVISATREESPQIRARAYLYRGHMRKHQGRKDEALAAFDKAAKLDKRLLDAQRESRALSGESGMREKAATESTASKAAMRVPKARKGPRSKYLSGPWPYIWVLSGLLLVGMIAAQIILRMDAEF